MSRFETNVYAEWRARRGPALVLREGDPTPPERLLQAVWFHQRLRRDQFVTLDGRRLQVLHPGFWNREAGPDFRGAVVRIGDEPPLTGDVEVDLSASGWHAHRHDTNPNFQNVALHVVWEGETKTLLPTLALKPLLDAPLGELALWLGSDAVKNFPTELTGQCCAPLRALARERVTELLHQAAAVRFRAKAAQLHARARLAGWEQALWEGLFRALGYKHNVWPMQRLAELRARWSPDRTRFDPLVLQARLLGIGGLLPAELPPPPVGADGYVRRMWDYWWRERESFTDCTMPRELWRFGGLRPANHPQRRLALASRWLAAAELPGRLQQWGASEILEAALVTTLAEAIEVSPDDFWSWHWTLQGKRLAKPQPLLGATRVTDLAVNVILPWLWMRATEGENESLRAEIERRYLAWPCAEDNSVLKLARERLLGGLAVKALSGAAAQQGLLQVVRDFCEHSDALCADCQFPEMVRQWPP